MYPQAANSTHATLQNLESPVAAPSADAASAIRLYSALISSKDRKHFPGCIRGRRSTVIPKKK